jgi:predicted nucleic acid-binding protein
MDLVVDANILFAAIISRRTTAYLFFDERMQLFAPGFLFEEIALHKGEILGKTRLTSEELSLVLEVFAKRISVVPIEEFAPFLPKAEKICPDPKDAAYFALALWLGPDAKIWSNDKLLKNQKEVKVITTGELLSLLGTN